ncbi:MAG: 3-hydroxyacyl-CoA dehydrogenase family protein [Gemmataceae bacterium]
MPPPASHAVAVLGLGTMGHGIAQSFASAGHTVYCFEERLEVRQTLHERVANNLRELVRQGLLAAPDVSAILERLILTASEQEAVRQAPFITEAVWEDLDVKRALLARLEDWVADDAILASNSSAFPISQSGDRLRHPERAVVTHWFNPPHLVPVVEVVPGPRTSPETTERALRLLRQIGKHAIHVRKELPGFLVNRVQVALMREVWNLVEQGVAAVDDIDAAIRGSMGFRLAVQGPLEVYDFGGLDIQASAFRNLVPTLRDGAEIPDAVRQLIDAGYLGYKSGRGFHDYPSNDNDKRRIRRDRLFLRLAQLLREHDSQLPSELSRPIAEERKASP